MEKQTRPGEVRELALVQLDKAASFELRLSEEESVYGLVYIGEKLAKTASYLEQLGDVSMQLARISLEVTRQVSELSSLMRSKERTFRMDAIYVNGDRNDKGNWLQGKLEVYRIELEDWQLTHSYLNEIRGAVNDRIQLFKRLDSDIRLQHKLLEAKLGVGAVGRGNEGKEFPKIPGGSIEELEID